MLEFIPHALDFWDEGLGLRVKDSGFRVKNAGFRIKGLGYGVYLSRRWAEKFFGLAALRLPRVMRTFDARCKTKL